MQEALEMASKYALSCSTLLLSEKSLGCYQVDSIAIEIAFLSHEMGLY